MHEADIRDGRYEAPEAAGLELAIRALAFGREDEVLLDRTHALYDGMYGVLRT